MLTKVTEYNTVFAHYLCCFCTLITHLAIYNTFSARRKIGLRLGQIFHRFIFAHLILHI